MRPSAKLKQTLEASVVLREACTRQHLHLLQFRCNSLFELSISPMLALAPFLLLLEEPWDMQPLLCLAPGYQVILVPASVQHLLSRTCNRPRRGARCCLMGTNELSESVGGPSKV
ncbi:uncharacterized protein APUU_10396A [Aspergillus puulaauensis]|uniref:Uncharacterized protein n=1 Tax=Aspergillus puulaauensis TaxID=1220207 RepID=A0A7R7XAN1_9EURO|nr:uncharacterized protein APUU_10396A [Aspergillus puulaauensis]BCS17568.1 hypothetical protein APUU_10396A [Aspergillus puulaauensis]